MRCANSSGKSSDTEKAFFVDAIPLKGNSETNSFVHFSKRVVLFTADGEFATPANFDGQLVVGVKTNGVDALVCAAADWSEASVAVGSGLVQVSFVASDGAVGYLDCVAWATNATASADERALQSEKAAYDPDFATFMATYGGVDPATATARNCLDAMATETGKTGPEGPLTLLDEFIAGTDPTDSNDRLYATIAIEDGIVYVGWVPDLNAEGKVRRLYRVYGKRTLSDDWSASPLSDAEINGGEYRFFRVTVSMP